MADSRQQQDQQTTTQDTEGQFEPSQQQYDTSFMEMIGQSSPSQGYDVISQIVTSYFDTLETNHRQARRIADLWAQSLLLQQTKADFVRSVVPLVTKNVVAEIRRNPQAFTQTTR